MYVKLCRSSAKEDDSLEVWRCLHNLKHGDFFFRKPFDLLNQLQVSCVNSKGAVLKGHSQVLSAKADSTDLLHFDVGGIDQYSSSALHDQFAFTLENTLRVE